MASEVNGDKGGKKTDISTGRSKINLSRLIVYIVICNPNKNKKKNRQVQTPLHFFQGLGKRLMLRQFEKVFVKAAVKHMIGNVFRDWWFL